MNKPNLLLIVVDSLRGDRILSDSRSTVTPVLDRLAASGSVFLNSISSTSYTTPNFASLLTGRYSPGHNIRCFLDRLGDVPTLPEILSAGGYHCRAEVTGPLREEVGLDRGFAGYRYREAGRTLYTGWGEELLDEIRSLPSPWFLLLHLWEIHQPRQAPRGFDSPKYGRFLYDRAVSALDREIGKIIDNSGGKTAVIVTGDHGEYVPRNRIEDLADRYKSRYIFCKRRSRALRRFFEGRARRVVAREKQGRGGGKPPSSRPGIFQVAVPHGEHLYDYLIRTPLIIHHPPLFPPRRVGEQFEQIDLLPTILGALGIEPPEGIEGRNFFPSLTGGERMAESPAYLECTYTQNRPERDQWLIGIRTARHKLIFAPHNPALEPELYDLEQDPGELHSIAAGRGDLVGRYRKLAREIFSRESAKPPPLNETEKREMVRTLQGLGYLD